METMQCVQPTAIEGRVNWGTAGYNCGKTHDEEDTLINDFGVVREETIDQKGVSSGHCFLCCKNGLQVRRPFKIEPSGQSQHLYG